MAQAQPVNALLETRIDKWLWAARCYRTRSVATTACTAGHVKVNGASVKPSRLVRPGDVVEFRNGQVLRKLEVAAIADKRGPAKIAQTLYIDHSPPPPPREVVAMPVTRPRGAGRPSKRERRELDKLRGE